MFFFRLIAIVLMALAARGDVEPNADPNTQAESRSLESLYNMGHHYFKNVNFKAMPLFNIPVVLQKLKKWSLKDYSYAPKYYYGDNENTPPRNHGHDDGHLGSEFNQYGYDYWRHEHNHKQHGHDDKHRDHHSKHRHHYNKHHGHDDKHHENDYFRHGHDYKHNEHVYSHYRHDDKDHEHDYSQYGYYDNNQEQGDMHDDHDYDYVSRY